MNILKAKRIRHFLRLTYPVRVVAHGLCFRGEYPDLPGCSYESESIEALYRNLDALRRQWITEQVLAGDPVPLPNSHTPPSDAADRLGAQPGRDASDGDPPLPRAHSVDA
jgi:predicted RNase H-like HicB family nuclease